MTSFSAIAAHGQPCWKFLMGLMCECGYSKLAHEQSKICGNFRPWLKTITRRPQKCANCGENSLRHTELGHCLNIGKKITSWQPVPAKYKVGQLLPIQPKMMQKAVCVCGREYKEHGKPTLYNPNVWYWENDAQGKALCKCPKYRPAYCRVVSVEDDAEWMNKYATSDKDFPEKYSNMVKQNEAHREGFENWADLEAAIVKFYKGRLKCWRIEIEYVGEKPKVI